MSSDYYLRVEDFITVHRYTHMNIIRRFCPDIHIHIKKFLFSLWHWWINLFKVEILLFKSIVYLHRKKKYLFVNMIFHLKSTGLYFREINYLSSSRFCDFIGSFSRKEERRNLSCSPNIQFLPLMTNYREAK
jgi:hypothetical protein